MNSNAYTKPVWFIIFLYNFKFIIIFHAKIIELKLNTENATFLLRISKSGAKTNVFQKTSFTGGSSGNELKVPVYSTFGDDSYLSA